MFGESVRELKSCVKGVNSTELKYPNIPDPVNRPADNAQVLNSICSEADLLVLNNLKVNEKHFKGSLTFRRGNEWILTIFKNFLLNKNKFCPLIKHPLHLGFMHLR